MLTKIRAGLYAAVSATTLAVALSAPSGALPYRDDVGDEGAQEFAAPWDGVIQIYMWNRNTGGINFNCTGSLINPRTVLSAAHCFNSLPNDFYGFSGAPLTPIIAYGPDTFDALFNWIGTGQQFIDDRNGLTFALNVMTPPEGSFFGEPFPAADVALLSLLDPLYTLPTYGMLFSPIPADVLNEGVHVNMIGYGTFNPGSSTAGATINGRRRAGENMLGFLGNFNQFFSALGQDVNEFPGGDNNQMMYWVDFDQPDRTGECERGNAFGFSNSIICSDWDGSSGGVIDSDTLILPGPSFDLFPGDALPNEVGTAGGDSGGPLMAMNIFDNPLILGVLSGGFVEGFLHTAGQSYGKLSYYNPLYAYHEFISENNPYKYVTNTGSGDWFDETIWVQTMDPNYFIYQDGEIVNGLPDGPELGTDPGDPWGVVFDTDVADLFGEAADSAGTGLAVSSEDVTKFSADDLVATTTRSVAGRASAEASGNSAASTGWVEDDAADGIVAYASSEGAGDRAAANHGHTAEAVETADAAPTNTGPGSVGFVPSNFYGVVGGEAPRFYDVTIGGGTVSLNDAFVEIDRLSVAGPGARLNIGEDATLWSLISVETFAGTLNVDGVLASRELVQWGGTVTGNGFIELFEFNMLFGNGMFVPGVYFNVAGVMNAGQDSLGGLTIFGDYIQTSGGTMLVDITPTSNSLLAVAGNVSLGGLLAIRSSDGYFPRFGDRRTFLEFEGERVGKFDAVIDLPGVLFLQPIYGAGTVEFLVQAESFTSFASFTNPSQTALGGRLDQLRGNPQAGPVAQLYSLIDLLPNGQLVDAFENLVPHEGFQLRRAVTGHGEVLAGALRSRMLQGGGSSGGASGGGQAMFSLLGSDMASGLGGTALADMARLGGAQAEPDVRDLGNGFEVFFAGGLVDASAPTTASSSNANIEGGFAMAGIDYGPQTGWRFGGAIGFATSQADQNLAGGGEASSRVESVQLTGYASYRRDNVHAMLAATLGDHTSRAGRSASVGGVILPVTGTLEATSYEITAEAGYTFTNGAWRATPVASITWHNLEVDAGSMTGSPAAFDLSSYSDSFTTARLGVDAGYSFEGERFTLEPRLYAGYANRLSGENETIAGDFAGTPGTQGLILGSGLAAEDDWFEISAGAVARLRNGIDLSLAYETRTGGDRLRDVDVLMVGLRNRF